MAADEAANAVAPSIWRVGARSWQRWVLVGLLSLLLAAGGALAWLDTGAGHRFLIGRIARIAPESGLRIRVGGIEGSIYSKSILSNVELADAQGRFLVAPRVELDWWPFAWLSNRLDIDRLAIPRATLEKLPKLKPTAKQGPILPDFDIRLMQFSVDRLTIAKAVTGREQISALNGDADIRSGRALVDLSARVQGGSDALILALDSRPDRDKFDIDVTVNAPKGGVLATLAGIRQDANLRVQGDGSWQKWAGTAVGTLDGRPAISLRLGARSGAYQLAGTIESAAMAGNGLIRRISAPRLSLDGQATFQDRMLDGVLNANSAAMALTARGAIDMRHGGFDNLNLDLHVAKPQALLKTMGGQDIRARVRLDGPMNDLSYEYLLGARRLAFGKTLLSDVRAQGKGRRTANGPALIPLRLSARQLDGHGALIQGILRNFTLNGMLRYQDQTITSNAMQVRADRLRGQLVAIANLHSGRYDFALTGDIEGLLIPGLGVVDLRSKLHAVPGTGGAFTLSGQAQAVMRRLDNGFFSGLGGGLPQAKANLALGRDGRLTITDLRLSAPLIALSANGYRRPDGSFHFDGAGTHQRYGPFTLGLDGKIERPAIDVTLAHPLDAAGLRDVHVVLDPSDTGYDFLANGGSTLGAFTGQGQLLLPKGAQAVIAVERLAVAGAVARGNIRPVSGGLDGRLTVTGPVQGFVALQPVNAVQQIMTELTVADASFDGPTPISVRQGKLTATALLNPVGTGIDATLQARGVQVGVMRIGRIAANARLVDGKGLVRASLSGQRGRLFELQGEAKVAPGRVELVASGTLDRRAIRLARPALFTRTEAGDGGGWRLSPATILYAGGSAQLAGQLGGDATRIEARLQKLPLSLLDIANSDLGLGGQATGTLSFARPRYGIPTGTASLRVRGLTRSGLALSSRPIDLGVNAMLTNDRLAARATVESEGQTIGRAQALLTPLGTGTLLDRVRDAPLFAQLRYNGTADTLWRLTGIEIIDLSGPAAVGADIRGTLANPVIAGSVASDDATIGSPVTGMRLTGVKMRGRFGGSQLVISSMSGTAKGGGTVTGHGSFEFGGVHGVGMDLSFDVDNAALLERDDIAATATGTLSIKSDGRGGTIAGDLDLNRSRFTLGRAAAVAQIPELRLIEVNGRGDEFAPRGPDRPWTLAIKAKARNRLTVTGLGLDSEWRADLDIGGTVVNPAISGTADLVRGGYEFSGRRFDLKEGRIRFYGNVPVNPTLAIVAEANLNGISATINVGGTGLKPIITFASVPALPQDELLSRLLFGTSITSLSAPEALQLAAAVAALQGGDGGLDPINAVRHATGLDRLRILPADPTINQGTAIAAGKYVTRKTYVELITDGQGYSATRIEYQITRWLSILSSVSTVGRQSANLRVSKDY